MRHVAVVGSGPAGCYLAEAVLRGAKDARVDVIDRLPTPFGLVRFGVAPDHQSTKAVTRLLDRVLGRAEVGYFGSVELERDVSLDELRAAYDAVVLATGAPFDRRLGIPGEALPGVVSSGEFVGWYNHHPERVPVDLSAVRSVVVIGNGNVALDVARVLSKSEAEFHGSDLDAEVAGAIATSQIRRIDIAGRRGAAQMKFTLPEVSELGELARARPALADPAACAGHENDVAAALRAVCEREYSPDRLEIRFHFGLTPLAFEAGPAGRLAGVRFRAEQRSETVLPAELAVTCIGYETAGHGLQVAGGALVNEGGRIEGGLYVVGWAGRGPSGTIPTNRAEAQVLARRVVQETADGGKQGGAELEKLLSARGSERVDYHGWRRIDASEIARGGSSRARRKWRSAAELLAAAKAQSERSPQPP